MTDSEYLSPCTEHEPVRLYVHVHDHDLICACGRAFINPKCQMVVDAKNRSNR